MTVEEKIHRIMELRKVIKAKDKLYLDFSNEEKELDALMGIEELTNINKESKT